MDKTNPQKSNKISLSRIYAETSSAVRDNPNIYLPFAIFALIELCALMFIFLAPRAPFRVLLGPPIATIWGERFLHYPVNFLLLGKLESLSRMALSVFVGSLLTGIAVSLLYKKTAKFAFKKYVSLFIIVMLITGIFYCLIKALFMIIAGYFMSGHKTLLFIGPRMWIGPIMGFANFFIALLIQSLFIYSIPALLLKDIKFATAIWRSFVFFKRNFWLTILLVGLPMLIYTPLFILNSNTSFLMSRFFPEIVFWLVACGAIVNSLVIDPLITISTAIVYSKDA